MHWGRSQPGRGHALSSQAHGKRAEVWSLRVDWKRPTLGFEEVSLWFEDTIDLEITVDRIHQIQIDVIDRVSITGSRPQRQNLIKFHNARSFEKSPSVQVAAREVEHRAFSYNRIAHTVGDQENSETGYMREPSCRRILDMLQSKPTGS